MGIWILLSTLWAILTLKCLVRADNSAGNVMMDGLFADIAEPWTPLFPGGGRGSRPPQERDKR